MKNIRLFRAMRRFLNPAVIFPMPNGFTADPQGMYGLYGFLQNANSYSFAQSNFTTAGTNQNLTGANVARGAILLNAGASGGFTITLPTTAEILTALGKTIQRDSSWAKPLLIQNNNVGQTGTLTAGDGSTTLNGTMTIATDTTRLFMLTVTSSGVIIRNFGSLPL